MDATGQRWVTSLANYDFWIFYKSGKSNVEADALSHIPRTNDVLIDTPSVKAIISAVPYTDNTDDNYNPSNIVCKSMQMVVHKMSRDDWKVEQENDSIIGPVITAIKTKKFNNDVLSGESKRLLHSRSRSKSKTGKDINILIITDHFTRYAQAHVTSSQKGPGVAKTLWDQFFVHYGFPEKILLDQGRNFESQLISELCKLTQVKKLRTTPYQPEG